MIYSINEYANEFFGGSISKMAKHWKSKPQRVAEWRNSGVFFIVDEGAHKRCSVINEAAAAP